MSTLRVLLLGTPEVHWGEEILPIQRRYPRSMLLYLASQGTMTGREELMTIFWEDESEKIARLRLRETLNKLRSALPDSNLLISQRDLIGLDFDRVWVDQLDFERRYNIFWNTAKQIPRQDPLPDEVYQCLNDAAELWRGSRFLAGVNLPSTDLLDGWLSRTSQRTEHLRGMILQRLSDHAYVTGNLDESLRLARLALENDELSEYLHERILQILIRMDRRNEAREHFKYVLEVTRRELNERPSSRLFSLFQLTRASRTFTPIPSTQILKVKSSTQSPFVGRQAILAQLNKTHKKGGAVFILGESGLGKTRLLQEFIGQLQPKPRLLIAGCRPYETNLPFQPIIDIARTSIQPEEWINFPVAWLTSSYLLCLT
jgi:DNA-binding SARP family transcriptional activator